MISLEQAVKFNVNVIVVLLDCNIPDRKGGAPHDQFVFENNFIITGQHKAVDLIAQHLPGTPITLVSSKRRFQSIIPRFYKGNTDLRLKFISKDDGTRTQEEIKHHLLEYVEN